jgi:outer membrane protein assembly factor BamB
MSRYPLPRVLVLTVTGLALAGPCRAAKVKVWHQHTPADYARARLRQAVVSSEGTLRLSRRLRPLTDLDAGHVWDLAETADGTLYAATGDEGKVYKVTPGGKASVVYAGDQSQVLCLAVAADGAVFAGTGPGGRIVRIDPQGQARVLCETGASYVWSLAVDPATQALYAGTGPKGRVYKVTPEGKASVFYTTKQEHVLCVAAGGGGLYAGTDRGGLVYWIDARGKGFVLFQAPQGEVRTLRVTPNGIYAGTSAPTRRRSGGGLSSSAGADRSSASAGTWGPHAASADAGGREPSAVGKKAARAGDGEEPRGHAAPAPTTPAGGENSVYRLTADGAVREVFREKALVLSLLRQDGRFLVGTGMEGQLFEVDERTRERSEVARLDHGQVLCLHRRRDGAVVIATGDPGRLYLLEERYAAEGTVTSEVLDARLISRWGALRWEAETPAGTAVKVAVRSGNVADPDDTWSDWSEEQTDGREAVIAAPPARYLQYRVTLATQDPARTPALRSLTFRYATTNQAPEVLKVEAPDLNAVNLDNPKRLKFKWSAQDANEDDLSYSVLVRKEGWTSWVELEDDLDRPEYEWDTATTPSGVYRLKVVASDRKDNADADALTGERVSAPFVVCHTPPAVALKVLGAGADRVEVRATAASPLVRLTSASYAVDGKKWVNVFPADGLFDSKSEALAFAAEGLRPGTHVLVLRVRDAAGNTGSADVVFEVKQGKAR